MENQLLAKLKNNKHIIEMILSKDLQNILIDLIERQKHFNDHKVRQTLNTNSFKQQRNDGLSPLENAAIFESNQFQEFVKEIIVLLND
jgi:hypothetical protein